MPSLYAGIVILGEQLSMGEKTSLIHAQFDRDFRLGNRPEVSFNSPSIIDVFDEFITTRADGFMWRVGYTMDSAGNVTFDNRESWQKAQNDVVIVEMSEAKDEHAVLGEHYPVDMVTEADVSEFVEGMEADIVIGSPGFGNKKDGHFYSEALWRKDAGVFKDVKMYATNHTKGEHTVRNWVATVKEAGKRFRNDGAPIARIAIHKESFWKELKALKEHGLLDRMHTSILAQGRARRGKVDGKPAKIVESITKAKAIDFVDQAGAGGHVMSLIEGAVQEGDFDYLTFNVLVEKRPDIIETARTQEKEKLYAQIERLKQDKSELEGKPLELKETDNMSEKLEAQLAGVTQQMAEVQTQLDSQKAELAERDEVIAEFEAEERQDAMKSTAYTTISTLVEQAKKDNLSESVVNAVARRVTKDVKEGEFDEGADVRGIVENIWAEEVEYAKAFVIKPSTSAKAKITGMGENYQVKGVGDSGESSTQLKESVDDVMIRYGMLEPTKKEAK